MATIRPAPSWPPTRGSLAVAGQSPFQASAVARDQREGGETGSKERTQVLRAGGISTSSAQKRSSCLQCGRLQSTSSAKRAHSQLSIPGFQRPRAAHLDAHERLAGLEVLLLHNGVLGAHFELAVVRLEDLRGRSGSSESGEQEEDARRRFG